MLDGEGGIYGGRHRIQAMIDQGVKRTIPVRLELVDPKTGLPPENYQPVTLLLGPRTQALGRVTAARRR